MLEQRLRIPYLLALQLSTNQPNLPAELYTFQHNFKPPMEYVQSSEPKVSVIELLRRGERYMAEKNYDSAIKTYETLSRLRLNKEDTIRAQFGLCRAYFEKGFWSGDSIPHSYDSVIKYCDNVRKLPLDAYRKREALSYLAMAIWDKDPKKAEEYFTEIINSGIKDGLREHALISKAQIHKENVEEGEEGFSLDIAEKLLNTARREYPYGKLSNFSAKLLKEISEMKQKQKTK